MARATKDDRKTIKSRIPSTISGLLTRDNVNSVLGDLEKHKSNITDLIVLYVERDGSTYSDCTKDTLKSTAVFLLEQEKLAILNGEE